MHFRHFVFLLQNVTKTISKIAMKTAVLSLISHDEIMPTYHSSKANTPATVCGIIFCIISKICSQLCVCTLLHQKEMFMGCTGKMLRPFQHPNFHNMQTQHEHEHKMKENTFLKRKKKKDDGNRESFKGTFSVTHSD